MPSHHLLRFHGKNKTTVMRTKAFKSIFLTEVFCREINILSIYQNYRYFAVDLSSYSLDSFITTFLFCIHWYIVMCYTICDLTEYIMSHNR